MSGENATARRQPGTRQVQLTLDCNRLIAELVPYRDLMAGYVVLAAMLHCPVVLDPFLSRLHPANWTTDLHQIMARIALHDLRSVGCVDRRRLERLLMSADIVMPRALPIELATLIRVADLIRDDAVVGDAVATLLARRQGAAA